MVWEKGETRTGSISKLEYRVIFSMIPEVKEWMETNETVIERVINSKFISNVFIKDKEKAMELFQMLLDNDVAVSMDHSLKGCRVQFGRAVWQVET